MNGLEFSFVFGVGRVKFGAYGLFVDREVQAVFV
jgi:hypothetical protein